MRKCKGFKSSICIIVLTALTAMALTGCGGHKGEADGQIGAHINLGDAQRMEADSLDLGRRSFSKATHAPGEKAPEITEVTDDYLLLVNKTHPLAKSYKPNDMVHIKYCVGSHAESMRYMRELPAGHFHEMCEAAAEAGYEIGIRTAFRSYDQQSNIFWNYVATDGEEAANKYSARPGESEHQSGLCADVSSPSVNYKLTTDYGSTPEGMWLSEHAHEFGFIVRYPLGKEDITGYQYEPWHVRYVGTEAALDIYERGITLEEYLGVLD